MPHANGAFRLIMSEQNNSSAKQAASQVADTVKGAKALGKIAAKAAAGNYAGAAVDAVKDGKSIIKGIVIPILVGVIIIVASVSMAFNYFFGAFSSGGSDADKMNTLSSEYQSMYNSLMSSSGAFGIAESDIVDKINKELKPIPNVSSKISSGYTQAVCLSSLKSYTLSNDSDGYCNYTSNPSLNQFASMKLTDVGREYTNAMYSIPDSHSKTSYLINYNDIIFDNQGLGVNAFATLYRMRVANATGSKTDTNNNGGSTSSASSASSKVSSSSSTSSTSSSSAEKAKPASTAAYSLTTAERQLIEQTVANEAEGEPFNGQKAVAQCMKDRCVDSSKRPASVVIDGQFAVTGSQKITDSVKNAVSDVFDKGKNAVPEDITSFYAPAICTSAWHESQIYVTTIGGHRFFAAGKGNGSTDYSAFVDFMNAHAKEFLTYSVTKTKTKFAGPANPNIGDGKQYATDVYTIDVNYVSDKKMAAIFGVTEKDVVSAKQLDAYSSQMLGSEGQSIDHTYWQPVQDVYATIFEGASNVSGVLASPINGEHKIMTAFSPSHPGLDISAPEGSKVYAVAPGWVYQSSEDPKFGDNKLGNYVILTDGNKMYVYAGLKSVTPKIDSIGKLGPSGPRMISVGTELGVVGTSGSIDGKVTTPRLHFELYDDPKLSNYKGPTKYINPSNLFSPAFMTAGLTDNAGDGQISTINGWEWPVPSCKQITSRYGMRDGKLHKGIDICNGPINGKPVIAIDDGVVIHAKDDGHHGTYANYGNCVVIKLSNGTVALYAHLSKMAVANGAKVTKGQVLGNVGETGDAQGAHLHFEIRINGTATNPLNYYKQEEFHYTIHE